MTDVTAHAGDWLSRGAAPPVAVPTESPSIPRLVRRAQRGSRRARARIVADLQAPVFRFCRSMLGGEQRAREATQETALRLLEGLADFRGRSKLQTWALGIALNVCREMRRDSAAAGSNHHHTLTDAVESRDPALALGHDEDCARLHAMLRALPERQREAVVLRYFEGLSVQQTADAMQCAAGTVKATISQALRNLRRQWSHQP